MFQVKTTANLALFLLVSAPVATVSGQQVTSPANLSLDTRSESVCPFCNPVQSKTVDRRNASLQIPNVILIDHRRREIRFPEELSSKGVTVVQFFFSSCTTICPALTGSSGKMQEELDGEVDLRVFSISIDPLHDTPSRLAEFATQFNAGKHWSFCTGKVSDIKKLQVAFDADQQNKMQHEPLTFFRDSRTEQWVRINGVVSGSQLVSEIRQHVAGLDSPLIDPDENRAQPKAGADHVDILP